MGLLWGLGGALLLSVVVVVVDCLDMLLSHRLSYNNFKWSALHGVAVVLVRYGLFPGVWSRLSGSSAYVGFGLVSFSATIAAYWLIGRNLSYGRNQRQFVLAFLLGFLASSVGVGWLSGVVLFIVGVMKFGFV